MDTLLVRQDDLTDQRRKNLNGHTTLKDTESAVWNLPTKKILDPNSFKSEVYFKSKKKILTLYLTSNIIQHIYFSKQHFNWYLYRKIMFRSPKLTTTFLPITTTTRKQQQHKQVLGMPWVILETQLVKHPIICQQIKNCMEYQWRGFSTQMLLVINEALKYHPQCESFSDIFPQCLSYFIMLFFSLVL